MAADALADLTDVFARHPESRAALVVELGEENVERIQEAAALLERVAVRLDSSGGSE